MGNHKNYNKRLQPNANKLRANMPKAEACLWKYCLRAGMMDGYKFRRQRPIGPYIVDFACLELNLVIEVDGITHLLEEIQAKDKRKENYLVNKGYKVIRFTDDEVLKNMAVVVEMIKNAIEEQEIKLGKSPVS